VAKNGDSQVAIDNENIEKTIKIRMKEVLSYCVDYEASKNENKTLLRNRICERMLKKQSILTWLSDMFFILTVRTLDHCMKWF
jgi:hypothetical protein